MVKKTTVVALDADVEAQVFPVENSSAGSRLRAGRTAICCVLAGGVDVVPGVPLKLDVIGASIARLTLQLTRRKDEDLAVDFGRLGVLCSNDIHSKEENQEAIKDPDISNEN